MKPLAVIYDCTGHLIYFKRVEIAEREALAVLLVGDIPGASVRIKTVRPIDATNYAKGLRLVLPPSVMVLDLLPEDVEER